MNEKILAFYLGVMPDEDRLQVEDLLLNSKTHLMEFIALKRSFECEIDESASPSPRLKQTLKKDVARLFKENKRWIPVFAAAAAILIVIGFYFGHGKMQPGFESQPSGMVDTSLRSADNINVL